jgi:hypothetical protein
MAVYDVVVVGIIPLLTFVFSLRNSEAEVPFFLVLTSVALYFCVMGTAVWAWSGEDTGRWMLLATVTFVALHWIINAIPRALRVRTCEWRQAACDRVYLTWFNCLGAHWWYFNRKTTVAYYQQSRKREDLA